MPCIEISLPKISREEKSLLASELTSTFCFLTGHSPQILGIRFFEYTADEVALGGKLCNGSGDTTYLHMLVYSPRLRRSVKQKIGLALSEAFAKAVKRPDWPPVVIHLCEHPFDNIVVNGQLLTDQYEECAKKNFYYELPHD